MLAIVQLAFLKWWSWGCINARPLDWTKYVSNKPLSNIAHRNNQKKKKIYIYIQSISISSMFILGYSGCTCIHNYSRLNTISSTSICYHFGMISLTNPSLTSLLTGESMPSIPFHSPKQLFHPHLLLGLLTFSRHFCPHVFSTTQGSFKGTPPKKPRFPRIRRHCLDDRILLRSSESSSSCAR